MDGNGGKVAFAKEFVEFGSAKSALDEDDDLVEFEVVKELIEFTIFLCFAKFDVELLKTVQCEFGFVIDIDLKRILHELFANGTNFLSESGAEHHHLFLCRSGAENVLDITSHICMDSQPLYS